MWVFKTTALEPRSQQSNKNKNPSSLDREIVQKMFKSVHMNIKTKFEQKEEFGVGKLRKRRRRGGKDEEYAENLAIEYLQMLNDNGCRHLQYRVYEYRFCRISIKRHNW